MNQRPRALRVGLDSDGILYNFVEALRQWIHHSTGRPLSELGPATTWNFFKDDWGYTTAEFLDLFAKGVAAGVLFGDGAPYPGTVAALNRIAGDGHHLTIVTNRAVPGIDPEWSEKLTRSWIERWSLPIHVVMLSADKTVADSDTFLEDNLENYDALDSHGVHAMLWDRPWNVDDGTRRRVTSWDEVERSIRELSLLAPV